ncbi:MAG: amino acid ABC transporter permease [Acetobacteraceae bacterium]|nr:amino acid ABC transporter permease [Acetobacteraceae bacterium]
MSVTASDPRLDPARKAPRKQFQLSWSDPRFRNLVWQVVIVGAIGLIVWYLVSNTTRNLKQRHIATGFGYLFRTAGIPIGESLLPYSPSMNTYGWALLIGVLNTLKVAIVGVVIATILGTFIGIARLSRNWLVAKLAAVYVEVIRDIPVLLQLFFWYTLLQGLPGPRQSLHPLPGVFLSNRGLRLPIIDWSDGYLACLLALAAGIVCAVVIGRRATARQEATGVRPMTWPALLGSLLGLPLVAWLIVGAPFVPDVPELRGFNFAGGLTVSPEYGALTLGLSLYTASYIAEIVRSGILAVAQGQWEAAGALGLRNSLTLRKVVLPQALRVIIPPMTSQFLNLTKNSSLAVAIGYQDIVSIASTTLNQTGQAVEGIATIMAVYLVISLSISAFMNWYNARIALVGR